MAEPSPRALAFDRVPELLHLAAVRASKDKVDRCEFHPVQPWLAYVDRHSNVSVWNYESDEVGAGWKALRCAAGHAVCVVLLGAIARPPAGCLPCPTGARALHPCPPTLAPVPAGAEPLAARLGACFRLAAGL